MKLSTLNYIINAFQVASDDTARYQLCHVRLTSEKDMIKIQACNGHTLSEVQCEDVELAALIGYEYAVSPDALPGLKAAAKAFKNVNSVSAKLDGSVLLIETGAGHVRIETAAHASISFPDFEQVKPKLSGGDFSVSLNPELLVELLKSLREDKRHVMVTLVFKDALSPIVVEVGANAGVLMPMRGPRQDKQEKKGA